MRSVGWLLCVAACGGAAPQSATPTPTSTSTPTSPPPTGGSVLIGEIAAPKNFDPKPTVEAMKPQLLDCYNQARATNAGLHGKLKVRVVVNEAGTVINVDAEQGDTANDATLVSCISTAARQVHFPKPGGTATLLVPLVFRQ